MKRKKVILFDVDSKIPNLALMKLSSYYKSREYETVLSRKPSYRSADRFLASVVFNSTKSLKAVESLREIYGDDITIGDTGIDLETALDDEVDDQFPDCTLYRHDKYALGFLTRELYRRVYRKTILTWILIRLQHFAYAPMGRMVRSF